MVRSIRHGGPVLISTLYPDPLISGYTQPPIASSIYLV